MEIILNGAKELCPGRESLTDLLKRKGAEPDRVVIERNGAIVSREDWGAVNLEAGDAVEVVRLVGGG
ncbi:MAG: sulfur carrier protein ThiS [Spirochaetales bacterium]|nr:sulfur carrier protein ThiS [Spirochaetales bacterium]